MSKPRPGLVTAQTLAAVPAFADESLAARTQIAALMQGRRYAKNDPIIRLKSRDSGVFFLISGRVRATYFSAGGREVVFRELAAGEMFGELSSLDDGPRSAEVIALGNVFVGWLSDEHFALMLAQYPRFAGHVIRRLVQLVRRLSDRVVELSTLRVITRIRLDLLRLAREAGVVANRAEIRPSPGREDLANRIGTRREAVSHEMSALEALGVIERQGTKSLLVRDVARLEALVQEDHS